ncbi:helix-turn-helix domain-containing protein [Nonomuraea turcica]|uniref:helix-turn-helix domain-containing protein n=1 Tax=Nonomuraea sp. G32 TaxID=3067274 RepID=UPI0035302DCE
MDGPKDRRRSGRPPTFTPVQVAEVKALACQLPAETGVPLSRWSCPDLAEQIVSRGLAAAISASTVRRDPHLRRAQTRAAPVLDLHPRPAARRQSRPRAY